MDQLYSFSEYTLEEDKNLPDDSIDFSTLPKSGPYTELQIPQIRARLLNEFLDMLSGCPEVLPPLREVNHKITLVNKNRKYNYYLPRCPDGLRTQLSDKLSRYT